MCGRLVAKVLKAAWTKNGKIVIPPIVRPSYNVSPTSGVEYGATARAWDAGIGWWGLVPS
jgi:hypothetical protein